MIPQTHVPFLALHPGPDAEAIRAAIARVVESGWFILGPEVEAFEREFAAISQVPSAIGVGSGTDALALALKALGIGPGDEVITAGMSAAFSALAIVMTGASPVFADIDPERMTIAPGAIEAAIGPRTRAVMPVHLYGQAADMTAILTIARQHRLAVVEDCCQAHLATCDGQPVGTFGEAGAFSFYPTKNLGALGDGGAVVTADAALAERLRRLRNGGQAGRAVHVEAGVCSRLDELQAAVLRARLPYLRAWTRTRRDLAARYRRQLDGAAIDVPSERDAGHVYHLFPVRARDRESLRGALAASGIETLVHYPVALPAQPAFAAWKPAACPEAGRLARDVFSLPLYPGLSHASIDAVADAIRTHARP